MIKEINMKNRDYLLKLQRIYNEKKEPVINFNDINTERGHLDRGEIELWTSFFKEEISVDDLLKKYKFSSKKDIAGELVDEPFQLKLILQQIIIREKEII